MQSLLGTMMIVLSSILQLHVIAQRDETPTSHEGHAIAKGDETPLVMKGHVIAQGDETPTGHEGACYRKGR